MPHQDRIQSNAYHRAYYRAHKAERIATLKAEISRCDLVCANCHRIRTQDRYLEEAA